MCGRLTWSLPPPHTPSGMGNLLVVFPADDQYFLTQSCSGVSLVLSGRLFVILLVLNVLILCVSALS